MAGNSQRKGATRKGASRKGPQVGSGGQRRRGLEGRGPTPKATERTGHPAARRAKAAAKRATGRTRGARSGGQAELVYGRNAVVEALRAGVPGSALYLQQGVEADDRVRETLTLATEAGIALLEVPRTQLDDMSRRGVHQGLALAVLPYDYADAEDLLPSATDSGAAPLIVALDGVTDPRNLGAVIRSAAAFGAHGVVVPERRAAGLTAAAWKTSAGAAARVPVAQVTNLTRTLKAYASAGAMVVGLAAGGDPLTDVDPELAAGPLVLVVGGEGAGLSRLVAEACDVVVGIPMSSSVESLNAGVAAGIALYAVAALRH